MILKNLGNSQDSQDYHIFALKLNIKNNIFYLIVLLLLSIHLLIVDSKTDVNMIAMDELLIVVLDIILPLSKIVC